MELSTNFFKPSNIKDLKEKIKEGALLIDVRTEEEYNSEHIKDSFNIPLDTLPKNLDTFSASVPIVLVYESGVRTRVAENFLKRNGFEVFDGGSWLNFK